MKIAPEYGTARDFKAFVQAVHGRKMKVMLDGVFNHMGASAPMFQDAKANPSSKYHDWFFFDSKYQGGYKGWFNVANLPALKLENPAVRDYLWAKPNSVVQKYLRQDGIDGWRLDVAFELGPDFLHQLTEAAHAAKPGSVVIGEIAGYPADWAPAIDGVFNATGPRIGSLAFQGKISGGVAGRMLQDMVEDAGLDFLLRSWLLLDNHDTPRIADVIPNITDRNLARVLQMTLPGSPCLYYGSELGMKGYNDPANRAPMRWDLVDDKNEDYAWTKKLLAIRREYPALKWGDFRALATNQLLGYIRTTDLLSQAVMVLINPTEKVVREPIVTRLGKVMSWGGFKDLLGSRPLTSVNGMIEVELKPKQTMLLVADMGKENVISPYERIK